VSKRRVAAASGAGRRESPGRPMSTLRAPAAIPVDSERIRPPRSPRDDISRAHGVRRRERSPPCQHHRSEERSVVFVSRAGSKIPLEAGATRRRRSERRQGSHSLRNEVNTSKTSSPRCGNASKMILDYYNEPFVERCRGFGNSFILVSHRVVQASREPVSCDSKKLVTDRIPSVQCRARVIRPD